MNKYLILMLLCFVYALGFAQQNIDKEKLLELYQSQRYAEAASYLSSIYPSETSDVKALNQIAYCNMMAGNLVEAEKNYLRINELSPMQLPVLFNLANINSRRGNNKNAIGYLQEIIKIDTTNFNAYKRLADYTDSVALKIRYLQKANKINPTEADVAYDLASAYKKMELYAPAYSLLKVAIAADTGNLVLQQALLPIANSLKKYNEVTAIGEKLLLNDKNAKVMMDVAKAYFYLKSYKKALTFYKAIEAMDMQNEPTLYFTSLCYRELKDYDLAAKYAKLTITEGISRNTAAYYNLLGSIYEENAQLSSAVNAFRKALSFELNKNSYYRIALLYDLKLKQTKNAITYYQFYLKRKDLDKDDQTTIDYVKGRLEELTKKK
ncbi:tetratricopeptide repeat protein [Nubsella zeaxanthinifaciens]|uniref:tetratricopeptide repeat protein n=1 Tax=Nubsella zeaxanthinifaciens TaxID=392412 RepID=UPI000DE1BC5D|nr:tetratricopeptide repeat protein [Nubsella zeaxanthinifaciens]